MFGRSKKTPVEAGAKAPSFRLKNLAGTEESLDSILSKGRALLAFYKVSCPVCQLTFPYLERLSASSKMQVVGISQDDEDSTHGFNQRFGVTLDTLLDKAKEGYPASNAYGISSVPSIFVVESDGRISKAFAGFSKRDLEGLGKDAGVPVFGPNDNVPEWKAG